MVGCSGCAARRARLAAEGKGMVTVYRWVSEDGMTVIDYDNLLKAKAKVSLKGGSYEPRDVPRDLPA